MDRYVVTKTGKPKVDAYLDRVARQGAELSAVDAEALFDREWRRFTNIRKTRPGDVPDADYADILFGLSAMRSCARVAKETGRNGEEHEVERADSGR